MLTVNNSAEAIEEALRLDKGSLREGCNFIFKATLNGHVVRVYTRPIDIAQSQLQIMSIHFTEVL